MEDFNLDSKSSYIKTTANNYQLRYGRFATWANEDKNSKTGQKCRQLFVHFLSLRISQYIQSGTINASNYREIKFLDAGCGSGRDLKEFSQSQVTIPIINADSKSNSSDPSCKTCFNPSCYICEKRLLKEEQNPNVELYKAKIQPIGFDICVGFVESCREMGLNVVLADFVSFFEKLEKRNTAQQSGCNFHGIFALASLFHVPKGELKKVLELFKKYLNPDVGILLTSIPNGNRDEIASDGRWILQLSCTEQIAMLEEAGFQVLFQEQMSIYNGNDWIVLVSVVKK